MSAIECIRPYMGKAFIFCLCQVSVAETDNQYIALPLNCRRIAVVFSKPSRDRSGMPEKSKPLDRPITRRTSMR